MRHRRKLTPEEIEALSAPADIGEEVIPHRYAQLPSSDYVERPSPGYADVDIPHRYAQRGDPDFESPGGVDFSLRRTVRNLPGGMARAAVSLAALVDPYTWGEGLGVAIGRSDVGRNLFEEDRTLSDEVPEGYRALDESAYGLHEMQSVVAGLTGEVLGPFAAGTFANPYDPSNFEMFDPAQTAERTPILHALGGELERHAPATPWDTEYNPEWRQNIATTIEEQAGEILFEIALGRGASIARIARGIPDSIRRGIDDVTFQDTFNFDDIDMMTGRDYRQLAESATVELDYVRGGAYEPGAMGGVIADPETGRTFVSTAAHFLVGKQGMPVRDFQGIRATTGTGDIGTIRGISAIDLEQDIALLEVAGLTDALEISDLPLSDAHTFLGEGVTRGDTRLVSESGAYIGTTTAHGISGHSGAPLIAEGNQLGAVYLGTFGEGGMYGPGSAIHGLLSQVDEGGISLGRELSRRALAEGIHHRYGRGDLGIDVLGGAGGRQRMDFVQDIPPPTILMPQFQMGLGADMELQSRDPDDAWRGALFSLVDEMEAEDIAPVTGPKISLAGGRGIQSGVEGQLLSVRRQAITRTEHVKSAFGIRPENVTRYEYVPIDAWGNPVYERTGIWSAEGGTRADYGDIENWSHEQLRRERFLAQTTPVDTYGGPLIETEWRRRYGTGGTAAVRRGREREDRLVKATRELREEAREAELIYEDRPDFEQYRQEYKVDLGEDPEVTGQPDPGWIDPEDAFGITEDREYPWEDVIEPIEGEGTVVTTPYIDEYGAHSLGTGGTLAGDIIDSEKVSSLDYYQATGSILSEQTQAQLEQMFGGLFEAAELREAARRGDPALRQAIIQDMDVRDPIWRLRMNIEMGADLDVQTEPGVKRHYDRMVGILGEEWEEVGANLWKEGLYEEYHWHVNPIRTLARKAYWEDFQSSGKMGELPEPRWKRERREQEEAIQELVDNPPVRERERHVATPPVIDYLEPGEVGELPLDFRQTEAARLEQPYVDPLEAFTEEVRRYEVDAYLRRMEAQNASEHGRQFRLWRERDITEYHDIVKELEDDAPDPMAVYIDRHIKSGYSEKFWSLESLWDEAKYQAIVEELKAEAPDPMDVYISRYIESDVLKSFTDEGESRTFGDDLAWHQRDVAEYQASRERRAEVERQRVLDKQQAQLDFMATEEPPDELELLIDVGTASEYMAQESWATGLTSLFEDVDAPSDIVFDTGIEIDPSRARHFERQRQRIKNLRGVIVGGIAEEWDPAIHGGLSGEELNQIRQAARASARGEEVSARYRQQHELDVRDQRARDAQVRRERSILPHFDTRAILQAEQSKKDRRARLATLREMARERGLDPEEFIREREKTELQSAADLAEPLDFTTPRGRWGGGIGSSRTYGLELELITNLTQQQMVGELHWEVAEGLKITSDLSIRTSRSDFAVEHGGARVDYEGGWYQSDVTRIEAAEYELYRSQFTGPSGEALIKPEHFETVYGHELVFPVMQGQEGLDLIGQTLGTLEDLDVELNTSMGMHIHVGTQDLSNYDLVGVAGAFTVREPFIDLMHPPSRRGEGHAYAESMLADRSGSIEAFLRAGSGSPAASDYRARLEFARRASLLSGEGREAFLRRVGYADKYQKLNLLGYDDPGYGYGKTIEYRQPAPTLDFREIEGHIGFITDFVDRYAGKPLPWVLDHDPSLKDEFMGLDLTFEKPSEPGQTRLPFELQSADASYREGADIPGLERFLKAADAHPGIFYRFEGDDPSYISQDLAQTGAVVKEHGGRLKFTPDSVFVPGHGKYGSLMRMRGEYRWSVYNDQYDYDVPRSEMELGYVGRVGLYGHTSHRSMVDVIPEEVGFRASDSPMGLSDTERHLSIHFGTSTPFRDTLMEFEDVFLSHGGLARLPINFEEWGNYAQEAYTVNPKFGEFIETGNINLDSLAEAIEGLPGPGDSNRIWGDYLSAQPGSDILRLQQAAQQARRGLVQRFRREQIELQSADDFDFDEINRLANEAADEEIFDFYERVPDTVSAVNREVPERPYPTLTESQARAVQHTHGPAVVIAGPGAGKSTTLLERSRHLVSEGVAESNEVLSLVFGKAAAADLLSRSAEFGESWNIKTIDAFALSVVRENYRELGYSQRPEITLRGFEEWLQGSEDRYSAWGLDLSSDISASIEEWSQAYEATRVGVRTGREDYSGLDPSLQMAIQEFRREKLRSSEVEFADAISQAGYLLESNEAIRQRYQQRFPFVQVDEFQDVAPIQQRLFRNLSENIWAVGDLDQSIMAFRGAGGEVMREMIDRGVDIYNIEENFRSTPEIVGSSQHFISDNLGRVDAGQRAVRESGDDVSVVDVSRVTREDDRIRRIAGLIREGEETAILTRTHHESDLLKESIGYELTQKGWTEDDIENLLFFETLHASKGREWENVILPVNILGGRTPGSRLQTLPTRYAETAMDFAEEERLFYVGMTRAEDRLTVVGNYTHPYVARVMEGLRGDVYDDPGDLSRIGEDFYYNEESSIGNWFGEQVAGRTWGRYSQHVDDLATNAAVISAAAQLTVQGVRAWAGHDIEIGGFIRAGAAVLGAMGVNRLNRRYGYRDVVPDAVPDFLETESRIGYERQSTGMEFDIDELRGLFESAGAGGRWGRGSLSREIRSRGGVEYLQDTFGEEAGLYIFEHAEASRQYGQRSGQTRRNWGETLIDISKSDFGHKPMYHYDPETRGVEIGSRTPFSISSFLEQHGDRNVLLSMWREHRREILAGERSGIMQRIPGLRLQPTDVQPHIGYMMLPEGRAIARFFNRYAAEPDPSQGWLSDDKWTVENIADWVDQSPIGGQWSSNWVRGVRERKALRAERESRFEERRLNPALYEWQDPQHFFESMVTRLGGDASTVESFNRNMIGDPYARRARQRWGQNVPDALKYPIGAAGGSGAAYLGYKWLFDGGDEDEEFVLEDPSGYSLSPRYPVLAAVQRTRPFRRLRAHAARFFDETYGEGTFHGEMMQSVVLGEKGNLPREVKETFIETGQIHALVQSGMHVNLFSRVLQRFPVLGVPALAQTVKDWISPPETRVVEPSQSYWDRYTPSDDPWAPRFNPELPSQGTLRYLKREGMLPEDYEFEIPDAPWWGWWDPASNYERDEEIRRRQKLSGTMDKGYLYFITHKDNERQYVGLSTVSPESRRQKHMTGKGSRLIKEELEAGSTFLDFDFHSVEFEDISYYDLGEMEKYYIDQLGTRDGGYNISAGGEIRDPDYEYAPKPDVEMRRGDAGAQDVLPWAIYSMFGVVPEAVHSYFEQEREETGAEQLPGFEFDLHGSPAEGFNPWLDPSPEMGMFPEDTEFGVDNVFEGQTYLDNQSGMVPIELNLPPIELMGSGYSTGIPAWIEKDTDEGLADLYKRLKIDISDGLDADEARRLVEYKEANELIQQSIRENDPVLDINKATAEEFAYLDRISPDLAEKIVAFRELRGGFDTVWDLQDVSGIGSTTLRALEDRLFVAGAESGAEYLGRTPQMRSVFPGITHPPRINQERRLDLNVVDSGSMSLIPGVNERTAESIERYRGRFGRLPLAVGDSDPRSAAQRRMYDRLGIDYDAPSEVYLQAPGLGRRGREGISRFTQPFSVQQQGDTRIYAAPDDMSGDGYQIPTLDVDTATAEEFKELLEITEKMAQRIVEDREVRGAFMTPQGLSRVRGISADRVSGWADVLQDYERATHPELGLGGLLPNVTPRNLGSAELQAIRGPERSEALYEWNMQNVTSFQRSERIRQLGEIAELPPLSEAASSRAPLYDLQTATAGEFEDFRGIGPITAQRIVDYRDQHGFQTFDDLFDVKGIGRSTIESLRPYFERHAGVYDGIPTASVNQNLLDFYIGVDDPLSLDVLNEGTFEDLLLVPGASRNFAHRVLMHRAARGSFDSIQDFAEIGGISNRIYQQFIPRQMLNLETATPRELALIPGIGIESAERMLTDGRGIDRLDPYRRTGISRRYATSGGDFLDFASEPMFRRPGRIPFYEDDDDRDPIASVYRSMGTMDVDIEDPPGGFGFEYDLRQYQLAQGGRTRFPGDRRGDRRELPAWYRFRQGDLGMGEAFGYIAANEISQLPSEFLSAGLQAANVNEEIEQRLSDLERAQEDIRREIEHDATLTVSERQERLDLLSHRYSGAQGRLQDRRVDTGGVWDRVVGEAGSAIVSRGAQYAADKAWGYGSKKLLGAATSAYGLPGGTSWSGVGAHILDSAKPLMPALAPIAIASITAYIGERSLDAGYADVIGSEDDREQAFLDQFRPDGASGEGAGMRPGVIPEGVNLEDIVTEEFLTLLTRKLRESNFRGFTTDDYGR